MKKLKGNQNVQDPKTGRFTTESLATTDPDTYMAQTHARKDRDPVDPLAVMSSTVYPAFILLTRLERMFTDNEPVEERRKVLGEFNEYCEKTWLK